jgi:hypothetical protein
MSLFQKRFNLSDKLPTCYNCKNSKNKKVAVSKRAGTSRKLGYKYAAKLARVTAADSLQHRNMQIKTRPWEPKETVLVLEIVNHHTELRNTPLMLVSLSNNFAVRLGVMRMFVSVPLGHPVSV